MRLELESLLELADEKVAERGRALFLEGAIREAAQGRNRLQAKVEGSEPYAYRVEINLSKGEWTCTCPYTWGPVCKHVAAVALAGLEAPELFVKKKLGKGTPVRLGPLLELSDDELMRFLWQLRDERPELIDEFAYMLTLKAEAGNAGRGEE